MVPNKRLRLTRSPLTWLAFASGAPWPLRGPLLRVKLNLRGRSKGGGAALRQASALRRFRLEGLLRGMLRVGICGKR